MCLAFGFWNRTRRRQATPLRAASISNFLPEFADSYGNDVLERPAGGARIFDSNGMHVSNSNDTPHFALKYFPGL